MTYENSSCSELSTLVTVLDIQQPTQQQQQPKQQPICLIKSTQFVSDGRQDIATSATRPGTVLMRAHLLDSAMRLLIWIIVIKEQDVDWIILQ